MSSVDPPTQQQNATSEVDDSPPSEPDGPRSPPSSSSSSSWWKVGGGLALGVGAVGVLAAFPSAHMAAASLMGGVVTYVFTDVLARF